MLAAFFAAFPDSTIETEALIEDGEHAAWFWRSRGTFRGPFGGRRPNGKSYVLHGATLFTIRDGKILEQRAYWDRASLLTQLGMTG